MRSGLALVPLALAAGDAAALGVADDRMLDVVEPQLGDHVMGV